MDSRTILIDKTIREIKDWIYVLPNGLADVLEDTNPKGEYCYKIIITPRNKNASSVDIGIKIDETFDVHLGRMVNFTETKLSNHIITEILSAIKLGRLIENVWEWNNRIARSRAELHFLKPISWEHSFSKGSQVTDTWFANQLNIYYFFIFLKHNKIEYQAW